MLRAILYNLVRLASFRGRESRQLFWPYAIVVVIFAIIGSAIILLPAMAESIARMQQFTAEHSYAVDVQSGVESYHGTINANVSLMVEMDLVFLTVIILLAAAVVRRLHDRDLSGFWGLIPVPFIAYICVSVQKLLEQNPPNIASLFAILFKGMVSFIVIVVLMALLTGETQP